MIYLYIYFKYKQAISERLEKMLEENNTTFDTVII